MKPALKVAMCCTALKADDRVPITGHHSVPDQLSMRYYLTITILAALFVSGAPFAPHAGTRGHASTGFPFAGESFRDAPTSGLAAMAETILSTPASDEAIAAQLTGPGL